MDQHGAFFQPRPEATQRESTVAEQYRNQSMGSIEMQAVGNPSKINNTQRPLGDESKLRRRY
jgi:hypothetical protein